MQDEWKLKLVDYEVKDKMRLEDAQAYDSEDERGTEKLGYVRIFIQYVYNKGKLLSDEKRKAQKDKVKKEKKLVDVQRQIKTLEKPFGYFSGSGDGNDDDTWWDWFIYPKAWESTICYKIVPFGASEGTLNLWWYLYCFVNLCYFLITLISTFMRTDFFNIPTSILCMMTIILMYVPSGF